jgi:hypothetical protein
MTSCSSAGEITFKKINVIKFPKIKLRTFWIFSAIFIVFFIALYIYQVNVEIAERYLIKGYQEKMAELSKENKILEVYSAQTTSLDNVTELIKELSFEKTDKIHYIQVLDTKVVAK